jgi:hypothetical protein
MAASLSMDSARPLTIHIGCAGLGALSIYGLTRTFLASPDDIEDPVMAISLPILLGFGAVFSGLVWTGRSWPRWLLVAWVLFPAAGLYLVESNLHYLVSWFFLVQVFLVVIMFLPASNRWLKGERHAAT